jgi:predicted acylesterase/phospholipase RssA
MSSNGAENATPTRRDTENVRQAKNILRGTGGATAELFELAKELMNENEFGYARRILARARANDDIDADKELRLKIHQKSAICTYKDPDLAVDTKFERALRLLEKVEDLPTTTNQETLGITGAIYKRIWEVDNQKPQLERSLSFYLRGYAGGPVNDQGYTGINAAFVLDLLACQEEDEARAAGVPATSSEVRRAEAKKIREDIVKNVSPLVDQTWLQGKWWFYSTIGEAYFGLGVYDENNYKEAVRWLKDGLKAAPPRDWEFESAVRQLASLARLQSRAEPTETLEDVKDSPAWLALEDFLSEVTGRPAAGVRSAFAGKIGLGLSGGGFRASLYHIGVLARLAELDLLRRVEVISCVSGGSIIGAHYYLEVRKLLQENSDDQLGPQDYVGIVRRVQRHFLAGVQRNVRMRVGSNLLTNLRMIFGTDQPVLRKVFGPHYSRTMRAGELFESEIFRRVEGVGDGPLWLNEMRIRPKGEAANFNPKYHNWRRDSKVPILILNAATLNTGHTWHFTSTYMGEPPAGINSEIDGNDRLRRLYYDGDDTPAEHRRVRLGHAVGASACVPGLFEPVALSRLYPKRVVRLVDGGVCDNQGVGGLLEQGCNVILISDGSGQMESINDPSRGLLGVPLRSTTVVQARVRQAQYQDLKARRRSGLLRGFMFVHLKEDLLVDPINWDGCLDPIEADDEQARAASSRGSLTSYGVEKEMQKRLAAVRTDLDSFSDAEAYALMTSAYRMTAHAFRDGKCVEGYTVPKREERWDFLSVEEDMKGAGEGYKHLMRLLGVSGSLAFKIWKLDWRLKVLAWVLAVLFVVLTGWLLWSYRDEKVVEAITYGAIGLFLVTTVLTMLGTMFVGKTLMRVLRLRETLIRAGVGLGVGVLGWLVVWLHLGLFDQMFLTRGRVKVEERDGEGTPPGGGGGGVKRGAQPAANGHGEAAAADSPQVEVAGLGPDAGRK